MSEHLRGAEAQGFFFFFLGLGGTHPAGQINDKYTAHIKKKKKKKKRPYATLRKIKRLMVLCFLKNLLNTHYPYSFQKNKKNKTGNKNVMYAFKWYFYGFLYNTTFSENIHLDINSSTNVQNL